MKGVMDMSFIDWLDSGEWDTPSDDVKENSEVEEDTSNTKSK